MKIDGPNRTQATGGTRKSDKAGSASGSSALFESMLAREMGEAAPQTQAAPVSMADVLLAAQAVEDPTERAARGRMRKRAEGLLDELDKVRMAMLKGTLTVNDMIAVADVVASHRERIVDPKLAGILDEIDLRAQVELAKMRVALDAAGSSPL